MFSVLLQQYNYKTLVGILIKQFNVIATNQQYTKFAKNDQLESITITPDNKTEILIEYDDHNDQQLYEARPVLVDDDTDAKFDEIIQSAYKPEITLNDTENDKYEEPLKSPVSVANSLLSTSSLEDSIKIYNIQTGEIIKCRPEDKITEKYDTTADCGENIDIHDKNEQGENFDSVSQHEDSDEETVIIEENKSLEIEELEDLLPQLPKVKDLAQKFVSMENLSEPSPVPQAYSKRRRSKENILDNTEKQNKQMYMHSLTARSITKEFREGLKQSMSTPIKVPGGSKDVPDGDITRESSRPGSPVPEPGTIKSKLAFFESLKSKFSTK